jgi:hypothetical protein
MKWGDNVEPFYTCATVLSDGDTVVVGGLTVANGNASITDSAIFFTSLNAVSSARVFDADVNGSVRGGAQRSAEIVWTKLSGQPMSLDQDAMPKDRMAVMGDPEIPGLLYVAGTLLHRPFQQQSAVFHSVSSCSTLFHPVPRCSTRV